MANIVNISNVNVSFEVSSVGDDGFSAHFYECSTMSSNIFFPFSKQSTFLSLASLSSLLAMAKGHCDLCPNLPQRDHDFTTEEKEWVQRTACKHGMLMLFPLPKLSSFPAHECTYWYPRHINIKKRGALQYNFSILSPLIRLLGNPVGEKEGREGGHGRVAHSVWERAGTGQADGQWHDATPR